MDLSRMLGVNMEEIEKKALEAAQKQDAMLTELRDINRKLGILVYAVEQWMKKSAQE